MKRYEGLFILNITGEEGLKEVMDRISEAVTAAGGRVETVQKMEKRQFTRVSDKRHSSGFYVNYIFAIESAGLSHLRDKFASDELIYRTMFTQAPKPKPVEAAA